MITSYNYIEKEDFEEFTEELYDKSHRDFRDNELKNNAWKEISSIMQNKNMGKYRSFLQHNSITIK